VHGCMQVHAEVAVVRDEISERECTIIEQTQAVAASECNAFRVKHLEEAALQDSKQGENAARLSCLHNHWLRTGLFAEVVMHLCVDLGLPDF